ncbi:hypothetical protein ElyMa_000331800 [Elysia marginata]|uniref:Uncharacterized protein n=1 Tax=Elysia marginata TaxID=1093978 RepID=A0AAV4FCF1_9GAST|nr:hypothetical protein ElyMa_000331800 [Elysia marginata]
MIPQSTVSLPVGGSIENSYRKSSIVDMAVNYKHPINSLREQGQINTSPQQKPPREFPAIARSQARSKLSPSIQSRSRDMRGGSINQSTLSKAKRMRWLGQPDPRPRPYFVSETSRHLPGKMKV